MSFVLAFAIGLVTGLRTFTAIAVVAWAARLGRLPLGEPLAAVGSLPAVIILTVLAVAEYVVDKLPSTPNRTELRGLAARVVAGAVAGACIASSGGGPAIVGAVLGAVGGAAGCYAGYHLRTGLVRALGTHDRNVAVAEDLLAILLSVLVVWLA